jgi:hypothetical protein
MKQEMPGGRRRPFLSRFVTGRKLLFGTAIIAGFLSYNAMVAVQTQCVAQSLPSPPPITITPGVCVIVTPTGACVDPCDPIMSSNGVRTADATMFDNLLELLTDTMPPWTGPQGGGGSDGFIGGMIDLMVQALLTRLNDVELNMMAWWETMWWYNLRPAMQAMTEQWNTAASQQAENFQGGMDAFQENQTNRVNMVNEVENASAMRPSETTACLPAMAAGGVGRATNFSQAMRKTWQYQSVVASGTNKRGVPGSNADRSAADKWRQDSNTFETSFCDPTDNAGYNTCQGTPPVAYRNADTQVTKTLYNKLTIQLDAPAPAGGDPATPGQGYEAKAVKAVIDNLTGDPTGDPIQPGALRTPQGQELWLQRRGYLARYAAVRSVPQMMAGWRMPGSRLGPWIREIREDAGVPAASGEISDNPSYREVMHAMSVDRFNTGKYANNLISDQSEIEMEKLTLSTFYLMQLRDYYELLERQALTLAVQVSMMAEGIPVPNRTAGQPVR